MTFPESSRDRKENRVDTLEAEGLGDGQSQSRKTLQGTSSGKRETEKRRQRIIAQKQPEQSAYRGSLGFDRRTRGLVSPAQSQ